MGETKERLSHDEAQDEAEVLRQKVESGEAEDYREAEGQISKLSYELPEIRSEAIQKEEEATPSASIFQKIIGLFGSFRKKIEQRRKNHDEVLRKLDEVFNAMRDKIEPLLYPQIALEQINEQFGEKYGLSFSKEDLPKVLIFGGSTMFFSDNVDVTTTSGRKINGSVIGLKSIDDAGNGSDMSEELAHFYRYRLKPEGDKREHMTDEFFGFLGSRLFEKAADEGSDVLANLKDKENNRTPLPKKEILKSSKQLKKTAEGLEEILNKIKNLCGVDSEKELRQSFQNILKQLNKNEQDNLKNLGIDDIIGIIEGAKNERRDMLAHQRGYERADKVDLDRIHDWKKLFSLPNTEVRKRFFTDKPDYSGL